MGSDVWLRSAEANIQLDGARAAEQGRARKYQPIGTLNAPRGTYTLKIGPVTRDFTVTRGQVPYIGDLNAGARHRRRSTWCARVRGDEIPVIANIDRHAVRAQAHAGEHRPAADLRDRPGLVPHHRLPGQRGHAARAGQRGADRPGLLLQRALERARARPDPGHRRADRPDRDPPGRSSADRRRRRRSPSSRPAGRSASKTFLTFNAGFCPDFSQLSYRNLGASLEFRFSREWKLQSAWSRPSSRAAVSSSPTSSAPAACTRSASTSSGSASSSAARAADHQPRRRAHPAPARWTASCARFARGRLERRGARHRRPGRRAPARGRAAWRRGGRGGGLRRRRHHDAGRRGAGRDRRGARRHPGRHRQPAGRQPPHPVGAGARRRGRWCSARPKPFDLGRMERADGAHYFAVACGAGYDARVMAGTLSRAQAALGHGARTWPRRSGSSARSGARDHIITDRRRGVRRQRRDGAGGQLRRGDPAAVRLGAGIRPDDGLLDVVVVRANGFGQSVRAVWDLLRDGARGRRAATPSSAMPAAGRSGSRPTRSSRSSSTASPAARRRSPPRSCPGRSGSWCRAAEVGELGATD